MAIGPPRIHAVWLAARAASYARSVRGRRLGARGLTAISLWLIAAAVSRAAEFGGPTGRSGVRVVGAGPCGARALFGVLIQLNQNAKMAREAQRLLSEREEAQRQRELAFKIVESIKTDPTATRRYATGLLKIELIVDDDNNSIDDSAKNRAYFIPMNSRVTLGRDKDNDVQLLPDDPHGEGRRIATQLSRTHCSLVADDRDVTVEDLYSLNGTFVSDTKGVESLKMDDGTLVKFSRVTTSKKLCDGDRIWVGPYILRFRKLVENRICKKAPKGNRASPFVEAS